MKYLFHLFVITSVLTFSTVAAEKRSSDSDRDGYRGVCIKAATSDEHFAKFKRNPVYNQILEHVSPSLGRHFLDFIAKSYPHVYAELDVFLENDVYGGSKLSTYRNLPPLSPSTLRYVKIVGDLEKFFGDLSSANIVEIGGGYGGQCFCISKWFDFDSYKIIDLPEPMTLTKRYLETLKVSNVTYENALTFDSELEPDLVISNYALAECQKEVINLYFDKVIRNSKAGYMIWNRDTGYTYQEMVGKLRAEGFEVDVIKEVPNTAPWNKILIWKR